MNDNPYSVLSTPHPLQYNYQLPQNHIEYTEGGFIFERSDILGQEHHKITHPSGTFTHYRPGGEFHQHIVGNHHVESVSGRTEIIRGTGLKQHIYGDYELVVHGAFSITADDAVTVTAPTWIQKSVGMYSLECGGYGVDASANMILRTTGQDILISAATSLKAESKGGKLEVFSSDTMNLKTTGGTMQINANGGTGLLVNSSSKVSIGSASGMTISSGAGLNLKSTAVTNFTAPSFVFNQGPVLMWKTLTVTKSTHLLDTLEVLKDATMAKNLKVTDTITAGTDVKITAKTLSLVGHKHIAKGDPTSAPIPG